MPRTRSLAWAELKIGMIAVVATGVDEKFVFAVGGQAGFSGAEYSLKTRLQDLEGLKPGAVIRVAGVEIGKVASVEFVGTEVEVGLSVKKEMQQRITTESRASIGSLSLLGEPVIDVSHASSGTPLKAGATLPSVR